MDASKVIPRRNNVRDAASAWVLTRTLGSVLVAMSSTVRPMRTERKCGLIVGSCRVLFVEGRWRPLLSAVVRQSPRLPQNVTYVTSLLPITPSDAVAGRG
jgi:hypothetical protein